MTTHERIYLEVREAYADAARAAAGGSGRPQRDRQSDEAALTSWCTRARLDGNAATMAHIAVAASKAAPTSRAMVVPSTAPRSASTCALLVAMRSYIPLHRAADTVFLPSVAEVCDLGALEFATSTPPPSQRAATEMPE